MDEWRMGDIAGVTSMHIQGLTAEEGGGEKAKKIALAVTATWMQARLPKVVRTSTMQYLWASDWSTRQCSASVALAATAAAYWFDSTVDDRSSLKAAAAAAFCR